MLSAALYNDYLAVRVHVPSSATATGGEPQRPINIGLLLDTSGSMEGPRLDSVKRTLRAARELFQSSDRVTLVTFDDTARVIMNHHVMNGAASLDEFYAAVDGIRANGTTNLSAGIEALYGCGTDYDMVLILTDGIINAGVAAAAGLEAMLNAPGRRTINTFGYGEDHCRALLRDLALKSRGAYTFIANDEVLPIALGDMLSGLREEVLRQAVLSVPAGAGWRCAELDGGDANFRIGNIGPGRDYWYVFEKCAAAAMPNPVPISLAAAGGEREDLMAVGDDPTPEVREQILRCRVARVMSQASNALEGGTALPRASASALQVEIAAMDESFRMRPLVLRLQGQLAEILATPEMPPPSQSPLLGRTRGLGLPRSLAARLASEMTCISTQRGIGSAAVVASSDPSAYEGEPSISLFSSPSQRSASRQVQAAYSAPTAAAAADPHHLAVTPPS